MLLLSLHTHSRLCAIVSTFYTTSLLIFRFLIVPEALILICYYTSYLSPTSGEFVVKYLKPLLDCLLLKESSMQPTCLEACLVQDIASCFFDIILMGLEGFQRNHRYGASGVRTSDFFKNLFVPFNFGSLFSQCTCIVLAVKILLKSLVF